MSLRALFRCKFGSLAAVLTAALAWFRPGGRIAAGPRLGGATRAVHLVSWIAVGSLVVSAQPAILGGAPSATTSPAIALASLDDTDLLVVGGEPVTVGVEGDPQTVTVTFEATVGQRVAIKGDSLDGYSWVDLRLLSPAGVELAGQQDWGSVFVEPVDLPSTGTYTVEVVPGAGQADIQVTPAQPVVTDVIDAAAIPVPWEHQLHPARTHYST